METWARGITAIKKADLGESPAAVNRETGVMYVNPAFKLTQDQWYFIMLHELGHIKEQTKDELKADAWAHKQYLKEPKSLKQSVFALTDLLSFAKEEDYTRAQMQLIRAQKADSKTEKFTGGNMYTNIHKYYGHPKCDPDYATYFTGTEENSSDFDKSKSEFFAPALIPLATTAFDFVSGLFGGSPKEPNQDTYDTWMVGGGKWGSGWLEAYKANPNIFNDPNVNAYLAKRPSYVTTIKQLITEYQNQLAAQKKAATASSSIATKLKSNNPFLIGGIALAVIVVVVSVFLIIKK
jgi:hypothetical protein